MPSSIRPSPRLLELNGISKQYPGVQALDQVDIAVDRGEVLAVVGENGAGKSTLLKAIGGAIEPDAGTIRLGGLKVKFSSPHRAQLAGVAVIYQEFNLVPALTVRENIFLGRAQQRWGIIDRRREREETERVLNRLKMPINPETPVARLSIAQQQIVEIARSLISNVEVLVMDEPTATLTPPEVESLFDVIQELKSQGIAIIYVSHRLDEILTIADRVAVLRDGQLVGERPVRQLARRALIEMMVGRSMDSEFPPRHAKRGQVLFSVENLSRSDEVRDVHFQVGAGEVLGMTGLVGAGRTEVAQLICGIRRPTGGKIRLQGRELRLRCPRDAISAGIAYLTEDRKNQGLILQHTIQENFGLPNLEQFSRLGILSRADERNALLRFVSELQIRGVATDQPASQLSGGNQQKLVLAKWLQQNCQVIVIDEPTRGVDVGAKFEIYQLINTLASQGKAIIMISSELPEVLGMSDRILVMRKGRVVGEIHDVESANQQHVMELAAH